MVIAFIAIGWIMSRNVPFVDHMIDPEVDDEAAPESDLWESDHVKQLSLEMLCYEFEMHGSRARADSAEDAERLKNAIVDGRYSESEIARAVHDLLCLCGQEVYDYCVAARVPPHSSQSPDAFGYATVHGAIKMEDAVELLKHFGETPVQYTRMAEGLLDSVIAQIRSGATTSEEVGHTTAHPA